MLLRADAFTHRPAKLRSRQGSARGATPRAGRRGRVAVRRAATGRSGVVRASPGRLPASLFLTSLYAVRHLEAVENRGGGALRDIDGASVAPGPPAPRMPRNPYERCKQ